MMTDSVKIFQITWYSKLLMLILFLILILVLGVMLLMFVVAKQYLFALVFLAALVFTCFGCLIVITEKTLVTTNKIINVNMFKKQMIPFRMIRRLYFIHTKNGRLLYVSTNKSTIRLCALSDKRLEEMQTFILEIIHVNDPEHFKLINLPKHEVEDFWR